MTFRRTINVVYDVLLIKRMYFRYYSATIIKMSGVKDASSAIWLAALTAAANFLFTLLGLYLVEKIGRKPLTLSSLTGKHTRASVFSCLVDST